jgi:lysophospholipase L1-like esterase
MDRFVLRVLRALSATTGLALTVSSFAHALPSKQSNVGDSISQAFDANDLPDDQPQESWVIGTDPDIDSVFTRYSQVVSGFAQEPESVSGAEMVGGSDNFAAQAARICAQTVTPDHVSVLLGGNDVCNRPPSSSGDPTANLYSLDTWTNAVRAGLDQLASCLPPGSVVQVLSMPRVDQLYAAGNAKSFWCSWTWSLFGICPLITGETDDGRRAQIGAAVDAYNDALAAEVLAYDSNTNGRSTNGVHFVTDWQGSMDAGHVDSSVGTHAFGGGEIDIVDCFHPNETGQKELACVAWATNPDGAGDVAACFP